MPIKKGIILLVTVQHGGDCVRVGANQLPVDASHRRQAQPIPGSLRDFNGVHEQTENLVQML